MSLRVVRALFILFSFMGTQAFAGQVTFRVLGVSSEVLLQRSVSASHETLGAFTHDLLTRMVMKGQLSEYEGSSAGVSSVESLGGAIEVLSDTEMKAYGWCYSVDGDVSSLTADQFTLTGSEKTVAWFYAYAHLVRDDWKSMCVPADHLPKVD